MGKDVDVKADMPLKGVRVLDVSHVLAGPYCTLLLADLGAEVIKVEHPDGGDMTRKLHPRVNDEKGRSISGRFSALNRNKKSLVLDLRSEKGVKVFKSLYKVSDVMVENFQPGTMNKLGLGYDVMKELNHKLVYASISGFGQLDKGAGPYVNRPAFDMITQAMGGLMNVQGEPGGLPQRVGVSIIDIFTGTLCAFGIMVGLYRARITGEGCHVDSALYDAAISLMEMGVMRYSLTGKELPRSGSSPFGLYPYPNGAFRAKNGEIVVIALIGEKHWAKFCKLIGRPDLLSNPKLAKTLEPEELLKNLDQIALPVIEDWVGKRTREEVVELLLKHDLPTGPVNTMSDIFMCPHVVARNMLVDVGISSSSEKKFKFAGMPVKFSNFDDSLSEYAPPPLLGEHTEDILKTVLSLEAK